MTLFHITSRALLIVTLCLLAPALVAQGPARVTIATVVEAPLEQQLSLSGTLVSPQHTNLSAQVDGYVTAIRVQAGDHLVRGQVLLNLDAELPRLEYQRLQAVLEEAEAQLADQRRRTREARDLMNDNNFSRSEFETLQAEVVAREARVAQMRAQVSMQRTRVERHTVESPFAGVMVDKHVEVGQRISGTTPLLEIARMDPLWADVRVPEQYLGRVHRGSAMQVLGPAGDARWIDTIVSRAVPVGTGGSRTFLVRAELDNADWQLAPGMSIRVQLPLDGAADEQVLQVPQDAVSRMATGETQLWVVQPGDPTTVTARNVQLGRRAGPLVEIVSGQVRADELVVTRGNEALRDGQTVELARDQAAR